MARARAASEGAKSRLGNDAAEARAPGDAKSRQPGANAEPLDEPIVEALRAADDKKAHDLVVLDVREVASFTDYFVIASAANTRQVQAIADEIVERLKKLNRRAARVEGYRSAEWVLLDYGDFVCHVFEEKSRRFYDLERLWRDAARVELPREIAESGAGGERA
ncbi:MAG: ribosome silencing factor [Pyrinomonadaceae bacterium]